MALFDAQGLHGRNVRVGREAYVLLNFDRHPKHLRSGPQPVLAAAVQAEGKSDGEAGVQPDAKVRPGCQAGNRRLRAGSRPWMSASSDIFRARSIGGPSLPSLCA